MNLRKDHYRHYASFSLTREGTSRFFARTSRLALRPPPVRPRVRRTSRSPLEGRRAETPCTPGRLCFGLLRVGGSFLFFLPPPFPSGEGTGEIEREERAVRVRVRLAGWTLESSAPRSHQRVSSFETARNLPFPFYIPLRSLRLETGVLDVSALANETR